MENKYNHSSLYNEEQMEQIKKEALKEYVESNREYINGAKRKFGIIFGIIVIILVAIKVFFGTINIPNIFGFPSSEARYYIVKVNDKQVPVSYNHRHRIPIIPLNTEIVIKKVYHC